MPCPVNSHNEWDPLEEVIVGSVAGAMLPAWDVINRTYAKPHPCPSLRQAQDIAPKERESFTPPHFGEGPGVGFVNLRKP